MTRTIYRGDSYGVRRPFYVHTFVDKDMNPLDLAGCTIRTTFKTAITTPVVDPTDATAVIKHFITIDATGAVVDADGLYLDTTAAAGVLEERLTHAETLALPANTIFAGDAELTDENGEVFTFPTVEDIIAIDAYTNRTTDA